LLADPGDPAALTEAIHTLWHDKSRSEKMGQQGREWIQGRFSLEQWIARMTDILESL
jgi:glycosyltransferase involved in cell wall biosynthesis